MQVLCSRNKEQAKSSFASRTKRNNSNDDNNNNNNNDNDTKKNKGQILVGSKRF